MALGGVKRTAQKWVRTVVKTFWTGISQWLTFRAE
jgi:hypothetical protein